MKNRKQCLKIYFGQDKIGKKVSKILAKESQMNLSLASKKEKKEDVLNKEKA